MKLLAMALMTAGAALANGTHQSQAAEAPDVLVVLAHPDDELVMAPAIARLARDGATVHLAFATSGDRGPGVSALEPGAELASRREAEAQCSANALGASTSEFWRLGDGTLASDARKDGSPAKAFLTKLDALYTAAKPDMILVWGPDGGYGHADHRMVSALVTQYVQGKAGDRPTLAYPAIPAGSAPPPLVAQGWAETSPDLIDMEIAYSEADLLSAAKAVGCHATQFDAATRSQMAAVFDQTIWQGKVHFRRAFAQ